MDSPLDNVIRDVLEIWEGRRDAHRDKRDFLQEHNFLLEAEVENRLCAELFSIIQDIEIAVSAWEDENTPPHSVEDTG